MEFVSPNEVLLGAELAGAEGEPTEDGLPVLLEEVVVPAGG